MMFSVGQKVVCVDSSVNPDTVRYMPLRPKAGAIYTVASIHQEPHIAGYGIRLEELPNPSVIWRDRDETEWSFDARRFRPLVETDAAAEQAVDA